MNRIKNITMTLLVIAALAGVGINQRTANRHEASLQALTQTLNPQTTLPACGIITDGEGHGSCVAIGSDLILTARHCLDHRGLWIEIGGQRYEILDQWTSDQYDVGFVRIDGQLPYLEFGQMPQLLDTVYLVGAPRERTFVNNFTKGIITKLDVRYSDPVVDWNGDFVTDCMNYQGGSGGPVLNEQGQIIGIYVGLFLGGDSFGVCVPVSHIREALTQYLQGDGDAAN